MSQLNKGQFYLSTCLLILILLISNPSFYKSQSLANYGAVRNTANTYVSINVLGASFNSWRNAATFTQDDNRSDFTNIGFDFWYNGIRYTQFCVSTNGYLDFSSSTNNGGPVANAFGFDNTAFTNANTANSTNPAIAPFYDDLTTQGGVDPLGTSIKYYFSGSASSRTLTIEWINMAVYGNTSPSLNFQVKLVESTGQIIIHYGTMNTGTQTFSYSMGLNDVTLSAVPTAAQLKMLQTVNSNTFNNTIQNNLSAMPTANAQYVFTPPLPTTASGAISFTGISQTGMTLNWPNWASNEIGYVIYNSTDGVTYNFVSQTAANATSAAITGLNAGTNYFWKLHAVTEGCLSASLNGTQATAAAGNKISNASGSWNTAAIWTPVGVPTSGDNVTISNGHTVNINTNAVCNSLSVGTGLAATLQFTTGAARTFSINTDLTISTGASFISNPTSVSTHSLFLKGNITSNGILNFSNGGTSLCNTFFSNNGNQTISGSGATTNFNLMNVNLGSSASNMLNVNSTNFSAVSNFLTLVNGTFKISTTNAVNLVPFTAITTLGQTTGLWLNSANAVVTTSAGISLVGSFNLQNGTFNIGNAANEDFLLVGGTFSMSGGTCNVAGKLYTSGINNACVFNLSNGTINVPVFGSTSTTDSPFQITAVGSVFNMSGGSINLVSEGGTGAQDLGYINTGGTSGTVSGGTIQIGTAATPASQSMRLNSSVSIPNLLINSANATAVIATNSLNVMSHINLNSGVLNANNLSISLGGNWTNTAGSFTPGTGNVIFYSNTAQSILKSGGETFNHINFMGTGVKTLASPLNCNGNFSVSSGSNLDISPSNYSMSINGNFINNGSLNTRNGLILLNGITAQTLGGSSITNFYDLTLNNTAGATFQNTENLLGTVTLNNGVLSTNLQTITMISNVSGTARVAQITGTGGFTGHVTVQRYVPGGSTGWALVGHPLSTAVTLNDWDDNIVISCPTCPDGYVANFPSIYTYDETPSGLYDASASYVPLSTINDPITAGKGYWVYIGTGQVTTSAITLDVKGTLRTGNYNIPLNYTNFGSLSNDGWNLITNPYPSSISWAALKGTTANIDDAVYVYNANLNGGTGGFASYVNGVSSPAVAAGGIGDVIPMCQAFYLHSTGATSLPAAESNKVGGNPNFIKSSSSASNSNPILRINLLESSAKNDEAVLYLQPGASSNFEDGFDSYKMRGQDPSAPYIALMTGIEEFQINGIAPISGNFTAAVKALTGYSGTYTLNVGDLSGFPKGACINLYDKFTNSTTDLRNNNYVFTLMDTTTVARFILSITMNNLSITSQVTQSNCSAINAGKVSVVGNSAGPWNYTWKLNGSAVKTSLNKNTADTLSNLNGGAVDVEINTIGLCDEAQGSFVLNELQQTIAKFTAPDTFYLDQSNAIQFINNSVNCSSIFWNFGDNNGTSNLYAPSYFYNQPGTFKVSLISTSNSGCNDTTYKKIVALETSVGITKYYNSGSLLKIKTLADNEFELVQQFNQSTELSFQLLNSLGQFVYAIPSQKNNLLYLPINLSNYPAGIYYLRITADGIPQETAKLVVK